MKRLAFLSVLFIVGCSVPFRGPSTADRKAECDQFAAQAINTQSLDEARRLAARASDCYAALQRR